MEEKSPTMLSVVFLKCLKITGSGTDRQGKFAYAVCDGDMKIQIPQNLGLPQLRSRSAERAQKSAPKWCAFLY